MGCTWNLGKAHPVLVKHPSEDTSEGHVITGPRREPLTTTHGRPFLIGTGMGTGRAREGILLGQGVVHDVGVHELLGVIHHGCRIVSCIIEKALHVGVTNSLDRILEELVDKKGAKTHEGRE